MSKIIMSLDQGTTSSRTILFDDNGKIVDSGSHEKLLSSCKLYSQLHLKEKLYNAY